MVWVFVICAAIFAVGIVRWAIKEREAIQRYRDHLDAASDETDSRARSGER